LGDRAQDAGVVGQIEQRQDRVDAAWTRDRDPHDDFIADRERPASLRVFDEWLSGERMMMLGRNRRTSNRPPGYIRCK